MSADSENGGVSSTPAQAIRRLQESVINHIAAGEVVERPASVVKELLENALDAGASDVHVSVRDGGRKNIIVTDNGRGIAPEDVATALERHATSKITHQDDLTRLSTLGFRGEALSSIAAVSRLRITSRRPQDLAATRLSTEGGRIVASGLVGAPVGTQIVVEDLFFNTRPRQKFLRAPATEQAHVHQAVLRVALGARKGGFQLEADDRRLLQIGPADVAEARIRRALGAHAGALHALVAHEGQVAVTGFISDPRVEKIKGAGLWLFVNGRFVRDRMLQRALLEALELSGQQTSLCAVIFVDLPADAVDVNVHPQKLEVRFEDSPLVYRTLACAAAEVKQGLDSTTKGPGDGASAAVARATQSFFMAAPSPSGRGAIHLRSRTHLASSSNARPVQDRDMSRNWGTSSPKKMGSSQIELLRETPAPPEFFPLALSPPGFLTGSFSDSLVLIDLIQAFRHLVLTQLAFQTGAKDMPREALIMPVTFSLDESEGALFEEHLREISRWGLQIRRVGRLTFCLVEAAAIWKDALSSDALQQLGSLVAQHHDVFHGEEGARKVAKDFLDSLEEPRWGDTADHVWRRLEALLSAYATGLRTMRGVAFIDSEQAYSLFQRADAP